VAQTEKAVTSPKAAGSAGGWMVQLGSFASRANADHLAQDLNARGFHATVSESRAGSRKLWRVRAGPAQDRAAAEQLAAKLRAAGHSGAVVSR
jgi:cell division septation protein DedD